MQCGAFIFSCFAFSIDPYRLYQSIMLSVDKPAAPRKQKSCLRLVLSSSCICPIATDKMHSKTADFAVPPPGELV